MADCSFKNRNESSVDISSGHPTDPETSMDQSQQLELVMEQFTPWVFDEEPLAEEQTHKYDKRANALNIHCEKMNVDLNAEKKLENEENIDLQEAVEAKPKKVTELENDLRVSNEKVIKYEPDVSKPLEKISRKEDVIDGLMEEEKETDDDDKKNKEQIENKVEKSMNLEENLRKEKYTQYLLIICLTIALIWMKLLMKIAKKHEMAKQVDYCTASKGLDQMAVVQADVTLLPTSPQPVPMKATKSGTGEENAFSSMNLFPTPSSYKKNNKMMSPLDMATFIYEKEEKETDITKFLPSLHTKIIISYHPTKTTAPSAMASPQTDSSMPLVPSYYKEGYETSTAVEGPENRSEV